MRILSHGAILSLSSWHEHERCVALGITLVGGAAEGRWNDTPGQQNRCPSVRGPVLPATLLFVGLLASFVAEYWPVLLALLALGIFVALWWAVVAGAVSHSRGKKAKVREDQRPLAHDGRPHRVHRLGSVPRTPAPPVLTSLATAPWHSVKSDVYHNNVFCHKGNEIRPERLRSGTGGRRLCEHCFLLNCKRR